MPPAGAIRQALRVPGRPVVMSESSDSTGSGSPGDSTGLLKALLAARLGEPAAIFLVDPDAVARVIRSGVGTTLSLWIGGRFDRRHGRVITLGEIPDNTHATAASSWMAEQREQPQGLERCT